MTISAIAPILSYSSDSSFSYRSNLSRLRKKDSDPDKKSETTITPAYNIITTNDCNNVAAAYTTSVVRSSFTAYA